MPLHALARFVDDAPSEEEWRTLHALADAAYGALFSTVYAVLRSVGTGLNRADLAHWLATDNRAAALDALSNAWDQLGDFGLRDRLVPLMQDLALQAAEATPLPGSAVAFNARDPEALAAMALAAGSQITRISQTSRQAIPGLVRRTFASETPLLQQLSEIDAVIGLTPRQASRVATFRQGLLEDGMKPSDVQQAVERLARRVRRERADTIARTEGMEAVHMGQAARWDQAVRHSVLDPARFTRTWIVTPDDRLCRTICAPIPGLNPDGRGVDEPFETPIGPLLRPPAHALCRCSLSGAITETGL